jgi:hypothetical protein
MLCESRFVFHRCGGTERNAIHLFPKPSISGAQHSPSAGAQAIHALRDLLSEWAAAEEPPPAAGKLPVVYRDNITVLPLRAIESLAAAAVESRQHQSFGHVLLSLAATFERLPRELRIEAEAMILRLLPGLKNQLLTTELDEALQSVGQTLQAAGCEKIAEAVRKARIHERGEVARLAR